VGDLVGQKEQAKLKKEKNDAEIKVRQEHLRRKAELHQ